MFITSMKQIIADSTAPCPRFKLMPNATINEYVSGEWHHDRCGRRLRVFVFVHDVDFESMPVTQVARGSHDMVFYTHVDNIALTRFSDDYIRSHYEVVSLDGPAGVPLRDLWLMTSLVAPPSVRWRIHAGLQCHSSCSSGKS